MTLEHADVAPADVDAPLVEDIPDGFGAAYVVRVLHSVFIGSLPSDSYNSRR